MYTCIHIHAYAYVAMIIVTRCLNNPTNAHTPNYKLAIMFHMLYKAMLMSKNG